MRRPPQDDQPLNEDELSVFGRKNPAPRIFAALDVVWLMIFAFSVWWFKSEPRPPRGVITGGLNAVLFFTCATWPILLTLVQLAYARRRKLKLMRVLPIYRLFMLVVGARYILILWIPTRVWG